MALHCTNQFTFTWKIKNFLSCYQVIGERMESPVFTVNNLSVKEWYLWLYPAGDLLKPDFISCYLHRKIPDIIFESIVIDYRIEILDEAGNVLKCSERKNMEFKMNGSWGGRICSRRKLLEKIQCWKEDTLTIRCIINSVDNAQLSTVECESLTVVDVDRWLAVWEVEISKLFNREECVPLLNTSLPDFKIFLNVSEEDVAVNIQLLNESLLQESLVFRLTFLCCDTVMIASKCESHTFASLDTWQYKGFARKEDFLLGNSGFPLLKYATFICEYSVSKKCIATSIIKRYTIRSTSKSTATPTDPSSSSLQQDFRELFVHKKYSDVKLRVGNCELPVHKAVLAARSPVFAVMFDQDMLENETGVVDIVDIDEETLENFIEFMYTDKVREMSYKCALKLLLIADKYQVITLKDVCSSFIFSSLSEENIGEIITVANLVNCEGLKSVAMNYIVANSAKVFKTQGWVQLIKNNAKLATEILCTLTKYLENQKISKFKI